MNVLVLVLLFCPTLTKQYLGAVMTKKQVSLCERLKLLGFRQANQIRLYGKIFELQGDPLIMADNLVLMDAIERKSGQLRRIRIPLPIVSMASADQNAA